MSEFVLPIFPADNVAVSLTTTVWIGVLVVAFFNLRFGWPMSGLIVPGYLVPLIIAKPLSAIVIMLEAVLTYAIVRTLSTQGARVAAWTGFFGRDRFFAFVVVSVLVRALLDGWILPLSCQWLDQSYGISLDYQNDVHSFGLLIVALIANYFWKPGLVRGLGPMSCVVGITFAIVRYGLGEFTNLNLGQLHYLYDDIAASLLASPKAYIIIITSAWLASYFNNQYGWEYSGILIPALLSLLWHSPWKIAVTLLEAVLILVIAALVLKLPLWRQMTMKGGRKLVLFFSVCFAYRLIMAHLAPHFQCFEQVTDSYGFGYLLTTLLAIRSHDRGTTVRVMRGTIQASMIGAVAGSSLGFLLMWVPTQSTASASFNVDAELITATPTNRSLRELIADCKIDLYRKRLPGSYLVPNQMDIDHFGVGMRHLVDYQINRDEQDLTTACAMLKRAHFEVMLAEDRYLVVREEMPSRGWGTYVLNLESPQGLLVEVPAPLDEWGTSESGALLFQQLRATSLAIGGTGRRTNEDGSADLLAVPRTLFAAFHHLVGHHNTLQVRGQTLSGSVNEISEDSGKISADQVADNTLWINRQMPRSLRLPALNAVVSTYDAQWQTSPHTNALRDTSPTGFAELFLSRSTRRRLVSQWHLADQKIESAAVVRTCESNITDWIYGQQSRIARRGSNNYRPATIEEMLFVDEEVLRPLLTVIREASHNGPLTSDAASELRSIAASAAAVGYAVEQINDSVRGHRYIALVEGEPVERHWGTYVFRCGKTEPYVVEVPRPLLETFSFDVGVAMFQRLEGAMLAFAGTHPHANDDGSSNLTRLGNHVNLFNLVHQVVLREVYGAPLLVVQCRAIRAPVSADIVLSPYGGATRSDYLSPLALQLTKSLDQDGFQWRLADGAPDTAGYETSFPLTSTPIEHAENAELITLWVSPTLRRVYRHQRENNLLQSQLEIAAIPQIDADLLEHLMQSKAVRGTGNLPVALVEDVEAYLANLDVVALVAARERWNQYSWQYITDIASGQAFLAISPSIDSLPDLWNVSSGIRQTKETVTAADLNQSTIEAFVRSRASRLRWERQP